MKKYSYCGIECNKCEIYLATVSNNMEKIRQIAKKYSDDKCQFTTEGIKCMGCGTASSKLSEMCMNCQIMKCAEDKQIETCAQCSEYPCSIIDKYIDPSSQNRKVLNALKNQNL